ncbi:MAG TPA: homoserine O-acetyltransferase [Ignavibacteriales bacterium]|nr:homoserine O-acetyltransferase [Ignavibacteriales bacterium]
MSVKTEFIELFNSQNKFVFENGCGIEKIAAAYQTYGKLNNEGSNAILICHALTGNAHAAGVLAGIESDDESRWNFLNKYSHMNADKTGWWDRLIGKGKIFDTDKYFVVCPNILGSCYGTTGPASVNPVTNKPYASDFPVYTVRDIVKVQHALLKKLGVNKLKTVAGGSLGGMQVMEWAVMYPDMVESIIPMATVAKHTDWAIGLNEAARKAIQNDPKWNGGKYADQPIEGLKLARMIAMLTYRSDVSFNERFQRERVNGGSRFDSENIFQAQSYLRYQGEKLVKRFDANTYIYLTYAMDLHDVSYDRSKVEDVLGNISAKTLSVGINTDVLYPPSEQKQIAAQIPGAKYAEINSIYGHDAFLIEIDQISAMIKEYIKL